LYFSGENSLLGGILSRVLDGPPNNNPPKGWEKETF
jgi:hypothetical protein